MKEVFYVEVGLNNTAVQVSREQAGQFSGLGYTIHVNRVVDDDIDFATMHELGGTGESTKVLDDLFVAAREKLAATELEERMKPTHEKYLADQERKKPQRTVDNTAGIEVKFTWTYSASFGNFSAVLRKAQFERILQIMMDES